MKRLIRKAGWFLAVSTGLWAIGQVVARRFEDDVDDDDASFRLAAFWGGKEFTSRADPLVAGAVMVALGGISVDLTEAVPSPNGVRLDLSVTMGGIQVVIPQEWRVEVIGALAAGDVHVEDPDEQPASDAPLLSVTVSGRAGGIALERAKSPARETGVPGE